MSQSMQDALLPTMDRPLSSLPDAWDVDSRTFWSMPGEILLPSTNGPGIGNEIVSTAPDSAEFYSMPSGVGEPPRLQGDSTAAAVSGVNDHVTTHQKDDFVNFAMMPEDRNQPYVDVSPPRAQPEFEVVPEDRKHNQPLANVTHAPEWHSKLDSERLARLDKLLMLNSTAGPRFTSPDDCATWLSQQMGLPAETIYRYAAELMLQRSKGHLSQRRGHSTQLEGGARSRNNHNAVVAV